MPKKYAKNFGIEHHILDFKKEFKEHVINDFITCYSNAKTPNPCIQCNKYLKFNYFYEKSLELGCDYIATGHYAKIEYSDRYNQYVLKKSKALNKDQSYVLYNMPTKIMKNVLFPLGDFENKEQIRKIAEENNLKVAQKPDSQEICFIPDNNYEKFILKNLKKQPEIGNIVTKDKIILGKHKGLINYTVGQRKGLGISNKTPLYVTELNKEKNELVVGEEEDIYLKELIATNLNYTLEIARSEPIKVQAKIRYSAKPANAVLYNIDVDKVRLIFDKPQRAITKGQSVVFYIDDIIVGGGIIS